MDKYYLFSNVINVDRNHELFPKDLNVYNSHDIYSFIQDRIKTLCILQSHESLDEFIYSIRSAMTKGEAIEEIRRNSGTQFDPDISQLFLNIIIIRTDAWYN